MGDAMKVFAVLALAGVIAPAALAQHWTFVVNPERMMLSAV
jgi:hypothetical protein